MVAITQPLLRRRAEHNDGELSTLEEITLHQFDIEKIELLQECCRDLRIIFLQSNQIMKIENLSKLKRLEYLNLALNNIRKIENLEGCESLRKLDLTVNFIEDLRCVQSLKVNMELRELFLVGNPCTSVEGYRLFVIATLPQLTTLDGALITKSERIAAKQELSRILASLPIVEEQQEGEKQQSTPSASQVNEQETTENAVACLSLDKEAAPEDEHAPAGKGDDEVVPHTPEARLAAARELATKRNKNDDPSAAPPKSIPVETPPVAFHEDGRIRQRNTPKVDFKLDETETHIVLEVELTPFLDTSLMDLQVERTWVRLLVKGRPLDIALAHPIDKENSEAVRSQGTGVLVIRMLKEGAVEKREEKTYTGYVAGRTKKKQLAEESSTLAKVDYRNILQSSQQHDQQEQSSEKKEIQMKRTKEPRPEALERRRLAEVDFVDDDDVPPLE